MPKPLYIIRNKLRSGIGTKCRMENHHGVMHGIEPKEEYTLLRDAMRLRRFHAPCG